MFRFKTIECATGRRSALVFPASVMVLTVLSQITALAAQSTIAQVPQKPIEMLRDAMTVNGLDVPPSKPWHIKIVYDQFDSDGDNVHSGVFEEFYVGPKKYRKSFRSDTLTQTDVATESGLYRIGDQRWPGPVELQVADEVLRPLRKAKLNAPNVLLERLTWQAGGISLACVILRRTDLTFSDNALPKYCFDPSSLRLRYVRGGFWYETIYNHVIQFQDRYVAQDVEVTEAGKPFLKIHVENLDALSQIDESAFAPPTDSHLLDGRVTISSSVLMDDYLISSPPFSPPRGAHGKVNVSFVVGKDGHVIEAQALDGTPELRKAVLRTIREYQFRPFLIGGKTFEVASTTFFEVH